MVKGEIACNKQFLPFLTMFYTLYGTYFFHFKCTLKRHMLFVSFWTSLKFSRLEMAKTFPNKPALVFTCQQYKSFQNTVGKEEIACNYCRKRRNCSLQAISPFPTVFFYLFEKLSTILIRFKIVICKHFQFGRV